MMANKHLRELLQEDQEPFLLKNYVADRRSQLKSIISRTTLQVKKRKPIVESSTSRRNLCKQTCFSSFQNSPDIRKSPVLDFPSPAKSPLKSPNTVFLHIPARTAALLLEAAMRIEKQSSSSKPKSQIKNVGFGLFGSILKRLNNRNRTRKHQIEGDGFRISRKSTGKSEKVQENVVGVDEKSAFEMGFSCSCNHSRRNSTIWSESNEEKSLDLETSSSCGSEDSEEIEFVSMESENGGLSPCEKRFCSSPLSPFRFSLQKSPSSGLRTPDFSSPAASPSRHKKEGEEDYEPASIQKIQLEEEKEQCSPVSVLDPPFDDDDDGHEDGDNEEDGYDVECSYAIVQRAKQQLLHKLRRFEKLAELDPTELEKIMLEEQEDDEDDLPEEEDCEDDESLSFCRERVSKSSIHLSKVTTDMRRLVSDLIAEEKKEQNGLEDSEVVAKSVCKRLDSWKEVESNTIDMMVELDFRRELEGWKKNKQQVEETAMEIELAIFGLLVEELSEELVC
ncbi:hypothetical protein F0562_016086 [Nyssa sinensis]|uniref:DUF4378 domain-containing protein n=1 Tax=Nyssa sinensis TaxID=561372 RepID=A0A5J4ZMA2_9ASTE|nr:hypothetical protein F0562_016086 [Nyssa sinensis]